MDVPANGAERSAEASDAVEHPIAATVRTWFVEHMHGSIVSRDTEIHNHVKSAVEELTRRLIKEHGQP